MEADENKVKCVYCSGETESIYIKDKIRYYCKRCKVYFEIESKAEKQNEVKTDGIRSEGLGTGQEGSRSTD